MNRPDMDDLKRERDGQTSFGRPPPRCYACDERVYPGRDDDVVVEHVRTSRSSFTRYVHEDCRGDLGGKEAS